MTDWNADLYRRFEDERTRPARELLARVAPARDPRVAYDLGCGPGNSTELVRDRFPAARVVGLDSSPAMLRSARARLAGIEFVEGDLGAWAPPEPVDLVFANAALQWVDDHEALVPRLFAAVAPGGVLAFQIPDNLDEPTHRIMREVAALEPFAAILGPDAGRRPRVSAAGYYDLLAPRAARVDVWRTVYHHVMDDAGGIVEWVRSTGLRPFVDPLPEELREAFLEAYEARVDDAYPLRADGRRLLVFPRLFVVAERR